MATLLESRVKRLQLRKSDLTKGIITKSRALAKTEGRFDSSADASEYITEAMTPVEPEYTKKTFEECDRVQLQIAEACSTESVTVSFAHQGSVTTDTHVKFYSDIDLLVLTEKFIDLQNPLVPTNPYKGDPMADLKQIRTIVEDRLTSSFPKAKVDKSGKKAVAISGGSLSRKIDIISASWLETEEYRKTNAGHHRGVRILDLDGPQRISNFPFLHNKEISDKDAAVRGALKKTIRFVKSARYDADQEIAVSSYDIASLCYHIPADDLLKYQNNDIALAIIFYNFSVRLAADSTLQSQMYVPNKTRLIFGDQAVKVSELQTLNSEIIAIINQAQQQRGLNG